VARDPNVVLCTLCPRLCRLAPGERGDCRIRLNLDGKLLATTFGLPSAVHVDPVEKKPLYHFLPGSSIFSLATVGCNLHCKNCQNWEISQQDPEKAEAFALPPERVVSTAAAKGCPSIAYTYTEPLVFYEYTLETSRLARARGLRNVLVTAGYLNRAPLSEIYRVTDAANTDLKAYDDGFYRRICGGTLAPVLASLVLAKETGVWLEVTNLLIPGLNDDPDLVTRMCRWLVENLGPDTPLHFSRFWPRYQLQDLPPTPGDTLNRAREIARAEGIHYVYVGNVPGDPGESTTCPGCGQLLIKRIGYQTEVVGMSRGHCNGCGKEVAGVWQ
jgi:pyruvate formate lyase activating enzyme